MASIRKLENGRWMARYRDPAGRQHARNFDRKGEAERWAAAQENAKAVGSWIDPRSGRVLFSEWAELWQETRVAGGKSTQARERSILRSGLVPEFGRMPLAAITAQEVKAWVARRSAARAATTVAREVHVLSAVMQAAVDDGLLSASPCASVKLPKVDREEMRFLAPTEVATLAEKIDPRFRALVLLGAYGGFRIGEMAGLKIQRVDQLRRRVEVAEIVVEVEGRLEWGSPKTRAGRRSVTLPAPIMADLVDHMARYSSGDLVFPAPEGGVLRVNSWRRRFWAPAVKAAGLEPLRPHDLRHTAVALWIASGANMLEVSKRAGHASTTFTLDRYGHLFPDADEQVADRLELLMGATAVSPTAATVHAMQT